MGSMKVIDLPQDLIEAQREEVTHRVCTCNIDVAICGEDVTGEELIEHDDESDLPECSSCVTMTRFWICRGCGLGWDEE